MHPYQNLIEQAYQAFNDRNIDGVLRFMQPDVEWPNGWEGGYVNGYEEVRHYWTRQWKELDPEVQPVGFKALGDGHLEVDVQQTVKDLAGNILFDGKVKHIYTFEEGKIKRMEIES